MCGRPQGAQRIPEAEALVILMELSAQESLRNAHLIWSPSSIAQFHIFLLLDAIEVLMQPIQEERQQLLRVMLLVAQKLGCKVANLGLRRQAGWSG